MKLNFNFNLTRWVLGLASRSWILTIIFFTFILGVALIVWNDCVFNPKSSKGVLDNILKSESEYRVKIEKIKSNNRIILERINNFNNPQVNFRERDYFIPTELNETIDMQSKKIYPQVIY